MPRPPPARRPAAPHEPSPGFVAVAWVRSPRGVRGELKATSLTDFPQRFRAGAVLWAAGERHTVRRSRTHRGDLLLELEGVDTRERAEALRGVLLEVPEQEAPPLPEGQYFRFEIVGMEVVDAQGAALGHVEEVLPTGANDVYIVRGEDTELLIPAIDSVVKQVDLDRRRMVVELMAGMERRPLKRPKGP